MSEPANVNKIKQERYATFKAKYGKALRAGCYLECILIDYAMIEDRLLALLWHLKLADRKDETHPKWAASPSYVSDARRQVLTKLKRKDNFPAVKNIETKLQAVEQLSMLDGESVTDNLYELWLRTKVRDKLAECDAAALCGDIRAWKGERNKLVHALFGSQPYGSDEESLRKLAEQGMEYAKELDSVVRKVKTLMKTYEAWKVRQYRKRKPRPKK